MFTKFIPFLLDAGFNWIHYKASVGFVEGETATIFWSVDIGSDSTLFSVVIRRGEAETEVIKKTESGILKPLSGRETDIDLVVDETSNVINITFILRNLSTSDEMNYMTIVINKASTFESKNTLLIVAGNFLSSINKKYIYFFFTRQFEYQLA